MSKVVLKINKRDLQALQKMVNDSPGIIRSRSDKLMARVDRIFKTTINRNPWRIGGTGGGVPVDTRHLFRSHVWRRTPWQMSVTVPKGQPKYASAVHEGTRRMEARPWMDYAIDKNKAEVKQEAIKFLDDVVKNLAK